MRGKEHTTNKHTTHPHQQPPKGPKLNTTKKILPQHDKHTHFKIQLSRGSETHFKRNFLCYREARPHHGIKESNEKERELDLHHFGRYLIYYCTKIKQDREKTRPNPPNKMNQKRTPGESN